MPQHRPAEDLKYICFNLLAKDIYKAAVSMEKNEIPKLSKSFLTSNISKLPPIFVEQILVTLIESMDKTLLRRRALGLKTCLEVLLQPHITSLDLSGLFFKMRLPASINSTIRCVVNESIVRMTHLTSINLVSKCDDAILLAISEHCPNMERIIVSISDMVTDEGLAHVSKGCPHLERLEIYKCWKVSTHGVSLALLKCTKLKELHCDELGNTFLSKLKHVHTPFQLTHFEQTSSAFEPDPEQAEWLGSVCPHLQSARLMIDDEYLFCLPMLGQLREVEIELTSPVGDGFQRSICDISNWLTTLHISCEMVDQSHLSLVGSSCKHLTAFHLTTASIDEDQDFKNDGNSFSNLTSLHLQIWKETFIRVECIDFFLRWCLKLTSIVVKAQMDFFTDRYLQQILESNPLKNATKISITSDKYVPLTMHSVRRLLRDCPMLESLSLCSWDVSEEDFCDLIHTVKENNLKFTVT